GGPGQGIYVSYDKGQSWETFNNGLGNGDIPTIYSLGFGSDNFYQDVIYAGDYQGKLYRTGSNPRFDPVIFIHGLGGQPTDWTTGDKKMHFEALREIGYPEHYLNTYTYADVDGNPDTYDNQGDVTLIAGDLDEQVDGLSQMSLAEGGSGKVDLVGFSLGGLVARQYLNTYGEDKVDQLITIASPHLGADILYLENWLEDIPVFGNFLRKVVVESVSALLKAFAGGPDLESPAAQQVRPESTFLEDLNSVRIYNIPTSTAAGDIDLSIKQKIFFWELEKTMSLGDTLMGTQSANSPPADNLIPHVFSDPDIVSFNISPIRIGNAFTYELDALTPSEFKYQHKNLIRQPEVVTLVVQTLTQ
ncbi:alpha/beta fold hydrolase, partial [Patescibacteria group bacterium]|nr:alpha/beta fold hydrolase [Patescibacteria group bacterium]